MRFVGESVQRENEMKSMILQLKQLVTFQKNELLNMTTEKLRFDDKISRRIEQKDASTCIDNDTCMIIPCKECIQKTKLFGEIELILNKKEIQCINLKKEVKKLKKIIAKSQSVIDAQEEFINNSSRFRFKSFNMNQPMHNFQFNDRHDNSVDINGDDKDDTIYDNNNNEINFDTCEMSTSNNTFKARYNNVLSSSYTKPPLNIIDHANSIRNDEIKTDNLNSQNFNQIDLKLDSIDSIDSISKFDNNAIIFSHKAPDESYDFLIEPINTKDKMTAIIPENENNFNEASVQLDNLTAESHANKSWINSVNDVEDSFTLIQQYYTHSNSK